MDRRQNNGSVKAVSPRHCPCSDLCTAQLLFQLLCLDRVTKTMSVAPLLTNNLDNSSKGSPTFLAQLHLPTHDVFWAQLHLPTHDLFWAKLRVQLHLPPLRSFDLAWNPGVGGPSPGLMYTVTQLDRSDLRQLSMTVWFVLQ